MAATTALVIAAGATVAGTGASMYGARQQRKSQEQLAREAQANAAGLFGTRPEFEAPEYNPLYQQDAGYADLVNQIIQGNRKNLPYAGALSRGVNRRITRAAKERIGSWDGGFEDALAQMGGNRDMALAGMLPYQDVMQIAGASGRAAGDFGFSGGAGPQTARDLGMQRSQLMFQQGPQLAAQITDIIGAVDPIQRHSTPQEFLLPTQFGVQSAINENQFGATFAFNNAMQTAGFNALPDPQARGMFDIRAMQAGMQGMGAQQVAQGLGGLSSLAMLYGGMSGQPSAAANQNVNLNRAPSNYTGYTGYTAGSGNPVSMRPTGI